MNEKDRAIYCRFKYLLRVSRGRRQKAELVRRMKEYYGESLKVVTSETLDPHIDGVPFTGVVINDEIK